MQKLRLGAHLISFDLDIFLLVGLYKLCQPLASQSVFLSFIAYILVLHKLKYDVTGEWYAKIACQ